MARRIVHQLVDDLDGSVLEVGQGETVLFSLDGVAYEIDLTDDNASALRASLAPYLAAARSISSRASARTGGGGGSTAPAHRPEGLLGDPLVGEVERLQRVGARPGAGIRSRSLRSRPLRTLAVEPQAVVFTVDRSFVSVCLASPSTIDTLGS